MSEVEKDPWDKGADDSRGNDQTITYRIYCCGEVTEVEYFNRFNVQGKLKITPIHGSGRNHALVDFMFSDLFDEGLITFKDDKLEVTHPTELRIWCVFDRDHSPYEKNAEKSYLKAISFHKVGPINIAWSNDSFEVWLLLHLQYFDNLTHRDQLYLELDNYFQGILYKDYRKGRADTRSFITQILPLVNTAVDNAKKLYAFHSGKNETEKNPATKVFELIEEFKHILGDDFPVK